MVYGFGIYDGNFIGDNSKNKVYQCWRGMIKRCYSLKSLEKQPSYQGTTVCDEWKLYSTFEIWYNENYVDGYSLDKDIINGSAKLYSPDTCVFVPRDINNSILESNNNESVYPLGVTYHKKKKDMVNEYKKPFYSQITKKGKSITLGSYKTAFEAHKAWQYAKVEYFNELILEYSGRISPKVIDGIQRRVDILNADINGSVETKTINKI